MGTAVVNPFPTLHPIALLTDSSTVSFQVVVEYIRTLVAKGGPTPNEYTQLNSVLSILAEYVQHHPEHITAIREAFGPTLSCETIQGFALQKPHGYAGDFEIIERIYNYYVARQPELSAWDQFFHAQSAPQAVRNRVSYFLNQIWNLKTERQGKASILNVASGPGRDMYESLKVVGPSGLSFECVDQDSDALNYAKGLCREFLHNISFTHQNVFRFMSEKRYDLVWSAGLFDYFNDRLFKRVLKRLLTHVQPGGRLVIGNFSDDNPTRGYMELFGWNLYHRSREKLRTLAEECGISSHNISVDQEPEGVNLFLHVVRP